ncbi:DUF3800 domain-containing protein [Umezawaea sp. Da 62-37]|uniref:DUF3800 domain-containing protein n=1 Tax=Umezawaea sp. Da 62-37 TaxID=3075927 RepID=UPI0028F73C60|nr:DUF3800 domain-containing protein [Umezawaea sp. Da 62-37]WNV86701.1 DUF3800 domain-containing protein [Umezawaea sp. Da 62-37]WNV86716.1 DUF3800 domain-containing protein [Umezawaea sp. Da 62-37]
MSDVRLFYIDDSGAQTSNLAVYGWVELLVPDWRPALRSWLNWRKALNDSVGLPASYELHATKFANGRGRPTGTGWDHRKANRSQFMVDALSMISEMPGVRTGAVCRDTTGKRFSEAKAMLYSDLVAMLDGRLVDAGQHGFVIMDGDGTDPSYRQAHRNLKLDTRNLVEDPFFQGSHLSQWVQVADLVAYAAYQAVLRAPGKEIMWEWYPSLLGHVCSTGGGARMM